MIFWYTGQPGHGKTLHAIDHALKYRDEGRLVYVCNVRGFLHAKAGCLEMTPEQFRDWPNWLPDGAVALVDEAYEHGMLPKRGPGTKLPPHVEQLAKHRHRGLDFIFVSQSPDKQVDVFVHDLIEQQVHVRRRFGLMWAHLRIFDRFERDPAKAHPLVLKRVRLPKRPMGLYESTTQDTSEKRVPWYYPAAAALALSILVGGVVTANNVRKTFKGEEEEKRVATDGAPARAGAAREPVSMSKPGRYTDASDWLAQHTPRMMTIPGSAPVFDGRQAVSEPEVYCAASQAGNDANGNHLPASCSCMTEQGTDYEIPQTLCTTIARHGGAYNPYRKPDRPQRGAGGTPADTGPNRAARAPQAATGIQAGEDLVMPYGAFREGTSAPPG